MNVATQFTFSVYVNVSILSFEYVEMPMVTFSKVHIEKKIAVTGIRTTNHEIPFPVLYH
jgi:hypothetical protein